MCVNAGESTVLTWCLNISGASNQNPIFLFFDLYFYQPFCDASSITTIVQLQNFYDGTYKIAKTLSIILLQNRSKQSKTNSWIHTSPPSGTAVPDKSTISLIIKRFPDSGSLNVKKCKRKRKLQLLKSWPLYL